MSVWSWAGWVAAVVGGAMIVSALANAAMHRVGAGKVDTATGLDTTGWSAGSATYLGGDTAERPLVVEARLIEPGPHLRRVNQVVDDLGTWEPWAHEMQEPRILGDVLAWRKWKTIRPADVGLVSA